MAKRTSRRLTRIFLLFFKSESVSGLIIIACTLISLGVANSGLRNFYLDFWNFPINLSFFKLHLNYSFQEWINNALMAVFFLMVGLEIERELYIGELSDFKNALLPIIAAAGGMLVPAMIHFSFNHGTMTQPGAGIPMATDIAFSLGALSLLGRKVPSSLKIFLTALAIIDDIGAVIVIAIFYNKEISAVYLAISLGIFVFMLVLNRLNVYKIEIYLIAGVLMWYFLLQSGVHATISGILIAFAIPFRKNDQINPSYKLQLALHKPVNYFIIPLFALANTGIQVGSNWQKEVYSRNNFGIVAGLFIGKPTGIYLFSRIAVALKWCRLPENCNWKILLATGILGGIGFTMSIFISNLAFDGNPHLIGSSKIAVLVGSLLSGIAGLFVLYLSCKKNYDE
ncbi:MAG TPA: Na+/H+ antiporter NhaA [Puia sp.]|nr:Na+/H+ antiporter NhaA [Puia sp.]